MAKVKLHDANGLFIEEHDVESIPNVLIRVELDLLGGRCDPARAFLKTGETAGWPYAPDSAVTYTETTAAVVAVGPGRSL